MLPGDLRSADPDAKLDGRRVTKVVLRAVAGRRTFWVDPERGSVPLRVEDTFDGDPSRRDTLLHEDLRLLEGAGWLPFTRLLVDSSGGLVERIELTDVELGRPGPAAFQLDFPSDTPLMDMARQLRYQPRRVWNLHHLPSEHSKDSEKAEAAGVSTAPEMPGEVERPSLPWRPIFLLLGSVCLAAALWRTRPKWFSRRGRGGP